MILKPWLRRCTLILAITSSMLPQFGALADEQGSPDVVSVGDVRVEESDPNSEPTGAPHRETKGMRSDAAGSSTCGATQLCWYEGGTNSGYTFNCVGGYTEPLGRSWVGWRGNLDSTPTKPRTGDIYYTKIGWGVSGFPCGSGGAYVHAELFLPVNTQLAISSQNPVECWYQNLEGQWRNYTNDSICPQSPSNGQQGGLSFSPKTGDHVYPTATGAIWEIFIPVKTTAPVTSGYSSTGPCPACVGAAVWMIDGNSSPWSYPRTGVYVDGPGTQPPSVSYPTPSVRNIQYSPDPNYPTMPSYAETVAHVSTAGTSGQGWFEIGKTKDYGVKSDAVNIANGNWEYWNAWRMEAGETWHWRFCYKPTGQPAICGADQTFETAPPPDTSDPTTSIKKKPAAWTNKTTASFEFGSNETNVQFWCNFDQGGWNACESSTPRFTGLGEGWHRLEVYALDGADNADASPEVWNWNVDLTKPETTLDGGPSGKTSSRKATFKFSSSEPGTFLCSLDGARFSKCSSPKTYDSLGRGSHTFKVKAKDRATNVDATPATREWKVTS